jgi:hypothetical protein
MKRRLISVAALAIFLNLAPACRAGGGDFRSLLRRLPDSTTALVVIDVKALRQALGLTREAALSAADISAIPITANKFVMGANVDLSEHRHVWSVGLAQLDGKMTIQDVARMESAPVQKVAGHSAVVSPRNAYFVDLGPGLLATATPANRKVLSHWLAFQDTNQLDTLPQYLINAAAALDSALMVIAVDLEDSVDVAAISRGLTRSQVLAARENLDYDSVARAIAQVKGIRLTVRPGNPLAGDLTVDFGAGTGAVRDFAKPLLLEILQNTGLYVADFDAWEATVTDNSVGIHGPLSVNALRKFGTLIRTPAPSPDAADTAGYDAKTPAARGLAASQRYFQSIVQVLEDLKFDKGKTLDSRAGWYEHAATQLNNLPTLDVAPELVRYGATTANLLQSMSTGLKNVSTRIEYVRHNSIYSYYSSGAIFGNSQSGYTSTNKIVGELKELADQARRSLWDKIDDATSLVRRQLTQRFNTQF